MAEPSPTETVAMVIFCLSVLLSYLWVIASRHQRKLRGIPIRIHVNGTRGKSTVTRLIAGAFREAGYRTFAKTTGSAPRLILADGDEVELARCGPPAISEQIEIVEFAAVNGADVLVIECMAVNPELQIASQGAIVQGTCSVVTNARLDHQDQMGETLEEIAWCLASVAPPDGHLVTGEPDQRLVELMAERAATVGAHVVRADAGIAPTAEEFGRQEWPDNLATALKVCELHGISRDTALEGMRKAPVDPGALFAVDLPISERKVRFVNAFAANDYSSTEAICQGLATDARQALFLLVNARADRVRRSQDLVALIGGSLDPAGVFLIGDGADLVGRMLRRKAPGVPVLSLAGVRSCDLVSRMAPHLTSDGHVVGIGNIGGPAEEFCQLLSAGAAS